MLDFVCHGAECSPLLRLGVVFVGAFFAVLFAQSSLDKVFDWEGNIGWLSGHFEKTFLGGFVKPLVVLITLFEGASSVANAAGAVMVLVTGSLTVASYALLLACLTLLQLFAGQRIAKDYLGAHQVLGYFTLAVIGLALAANA